MRSFTYILLIALFASCNPRLSQPQLSTKREYIFGKGFSADSISIGSKWWQMFGDTTLNNLVDKALAQNRTLRITALGIEEARHNLIATRAAYWPSFSGEISAEGKYESSTDNIAQSYKVLPAASWELPLFGSLRHATEQAKATIDYEVWQYRGVKLALEAEAIDEVPVGAVAVRDGEIIAEAYNTRESSKCATHHAEVLCIERACKALGNFLIHETISVLCCLIRLYHKGREISTARFSFLPRF